MSARHIIPTFAPDFSDAERICRIAFLTLNTVSMKRFLMLLVAAAATTELSAEGYQVNNLSTRQTGMGHVGTAMKLNSESIFFNPAGAAFQDSKFDLSVGASGILSYCTYTPAPAMDNGFYAGEYTSWDSDNRMSTPLYAYFNYFRRS